MRRQRAPRRLGAAMAPARARARPRTLLAAVQEAWPRVAGEAAATQARPVGERAGTITVACESATWAQELDLLQTDLLERLNEALGGPGEQGFESRVAALRFTADAARHEA